jgi:hypothetical protein
MTIDSRPAMLFANFMRTSKYNPAAKPGTMSVVARQSRNGSGFALIRPRAFYSAKENFQ